MKRVLLILAIAGLPLSAQARTWFVTRDGSGDFSIIQDAVDAAASGDTIRIGPGRYDEGRIVQVPGWTDLVRVLIKVEELTLIGAGNDRTIIGQVKEWDLSQGGQRGIQMATRWGTRRVVVDGIRFENMTYAINDDDIAEVCIRNCSFSGNYYSVLDSDGVLIIEDSRFDRVKRNGTHVVAWDQNRLVVARSSFDHVPDGLWQQQSISIMGVDDAELTQCNFRGGAVGFSGASGSHSRLKNCGFDGQSVIGIGSMINCTLLAEDCTLAHQGVAFRLSSNWEVLRTTVEDVSTATLAIWGPGVGTFRDCLLAKGERYVITDPSLKRQAADTPTRYDMRNNWWGSANPDSIQAWIFDQSDDPECSYFIDWLPYSGTPVHSEEKNLGSVKALFR